MTCMHHGYLGRSKGLTRTVIYEHLRLWTDTSFSRHHILHSLERMEVSFNREKVHVQFSLVHPAHRMNAYIHSPNSYSPPRQAHPLHHSRYAQQTPTPNMTHENMPTKVERNMQNDSKKLAHNQNDNTQCTKAAQQAWR